MKLFRFIADKIHAKVMRDLVASGIPAEVVQQRMNALTPYTHLNLFYRSQS